MHGKRLKLWNNVELFSVIWNNNPILEEGLTRGAFSFILWIMHSRKLPLWNYIEQIWNNFYYFGNANCIPTTVCICPLFYIIAEEYEKNVKVGIRISKPPIISVKDVKIS